MKEVSCFQSILIWACSILLTALASSCFSQPLSYEQALVQANQLIAHKDYDQAIQLLESHNEHFEAIKLLASVHYWSGNIEQAEDTYLKAMVEHPSHAVLKLDYGRMLYETKQPEKAKSILSDFLTVEPGHVEANKYLAYIYYQEGSFQKSKKHFQKIVSQYPQDAEALQMLRALQEMNALQLGLGSRFQWDSQPLNILQPEVMASKRFTRLWYPELFVKGYFFDTDSLHQVARQMAVGNSFKLPNTRLNVRLLAGWHKHPAAGGNHWIGSVEIDKNWSDYFSTKAMWSYQPSMYAVASLSQLVSLHQYSLTLNVANGDFWLGQAAFQYLEYFDDNAQQSAYLWVFSPALRWGATKWRVGYAGSWADTEASHFVSERSLAEILDNYTDSMKIRGIYDPYFTARHQQIHAIIGLLEVKPTPWIALKLSSNVGIFATADIPFLYLDGSPSGVVLAQAFFKESTTTFDLKAELNIQLSDRLSLMSGYQYVKNFFYHFHAFQLSLNWWWYNEE